MGTFNIFYVGLKAPCKGCTQREIGCHANCEKYLDYKKKNSKVLSDIREKRKREGGW